MNVAQKQIDTDKDAEQVVLKTSMPEYKKFDSKPVVNSLYRYTIQINDESGDIKKFSINPNKKLKK